MSGGDDRAFRRTQALAAGLFSVAHGELAVGGVPVSKLAADHGTPLYVYDGGVLRATLERLRAHLPPRVEVYYSVKANTNVEIVRRFVELGTGLEVASGAEYLRARAAGCAAGRIVFAGPGKGAAELELVVSRGIAEIHVESDEEIGMLAGLAGRSRLPIGIAVRFNPGAAASGGAMRMGGQPSQFGFDEERLGEV
ncbi:MAG: type III PLP-dependent enzyme, partial [Planctomycetota bacterium]